MLQQKPTLSTFTPEWHETKAEGGHLTQRPIFTHSLNFLLGGIRLSEHVQTVRLHLGTYTCTHKDKDTGLFFAHKPIGHKHFGGVGGDGKGRFPSQPRVFPPLLFHCPTAVLEGSTQRSSTIFNFKNEK